MSEDHLDAEALEAILRGEENVPGLGRRLIRHLLALCPQCRRTWEGAMAGRQEASPGSGFDLASTLRSGEAPNPAGSTRSYEDVFEKVLARLRACQADLERERAEAPALLAELATAPEPRQECLLREDARFHTWGVANLLLLESQGATFEDPEVARTLAHLAVFVAERLDPAFYGAAFRRDVLALAWACLGNARRVGTDLRGAAVALDAAEEHLERGVGDPLTRAQVLTLKASLRRDQRRFAEAEALLNAVIAIYRQVGEPHLEGRSLIKQAEGFRTSGRPADALPLLRQALGLIDEGEDARLLLCAHHNLASCLVDLGRLEEAEAVLADSRPLYDRHPDFSTRLRRRWLAGSLAAARGEEGEAEAAFTEVHRGFIDRGLGYDAALVALDLAALHAAAGRTEEVKALAEEMLPIFRSRDVHREAIATLLIFQRAALAEAVTVDMVRQMAEHLRQARHNPELRYEEPS